MAQSKTTIPNTYHFIWMGEKKPYFLIVAIQSVLLRCKGASVILWVDHEEETKEIKRLKKDPGFSIKKIKIAELTNQLEPGVVKDVILENFEIAGIKSNTERKQVTKPIERSRSNLLRYLILYLFGGVYLDADTLVLQDMGPLLKNQGFIGKENAAWPVAKREQAFHHFFWGPLLEVVRFIAIKLPFGYRMNPFYAYLCSSSENNAIMGFTAGHNYLHECFRHISTMDKAEILKSLRLGPFLLQRVSKNYTNADLTTYPEPYFYPYGPMISEHFFRNRKNPSKTADYMVHDNTYVIHWGASSKLLNIYTKDILLGQPDKNVFTQLESRVITEYEAL